MVRRATKKDSQSKKRQTKKILVLAAEGSNKTEKTYFNEFNAKQNEFRIIHARGNNTDPVKIVQDAINTAAREEVDYKYGDRAAAAAHQQTVQPRNHHIRTGRHIHHNEVLLHGDRSGRHIHRQRTHHSRKHQYVLQHHGNIRHPVSCDQLVHSRTDNRRDHIQRDLAECFGARHERKRRGAGFFGGVRAAA